MPYIHHSRPSDPEPAKDIFVSKYEAEDSTFQDTFTITLPGGSYLMQWYFPKEGVWFGKPSALKHKGGNYTFVPPPYKTDIALKVIKN